MTHQALNPYLPLGNYVPDGEPHVFGEDGSIAQVPMTSCGLNDGPLACEGSYPAPIACNLTNGRMPHVGPQGVEGSVPYITCKDGERVISGFGDGGARALPALLRKREHGHKANFVVGR